MSQDTVMGREGDVVRRPLRHRPVLPMLLFLLLTLRSLAFAAPPPRRRFPNAPRPSNHLSHAAKLFYDASLFGGKKALASGILGIGVKYLTYASLHFPAEFLTEGSTEIDQHIRLQVGATFAATALWKAFDTGEDLFGYPRIKKAFQSLCVGLTLGSASVTADLIGLIDSGLAAVMGLPAWSDPLMSGVVAAAGTTAMLEGARTITNIWRDDEDPLFHRAWESLRMPETGFELSRNRVMAALLGLGFGSLFVHGADLSLGALDYATLLLGSAAYSTLLEVVRQIVNEVRNTTGRYERPFSPAVWHLATRPLALSGTLGPALGVLTTLLGRLSEAYHLPASRTMIAAPLLVAGTSLATSAVQASLPSLRASPAAIRAAIDEGHTRWDQWRSDREAQQLIDKLTKQRADGSFQITGDWAVDKGFLAEEIRKLSLLQSHPQGGDKIEELNDLMRVFDYLQAKHDPPDRP